MEPSSDVQVLLMLVHMCRAITRAQLTRTHIYTKCVCYNIIYTQDAHEAQWPEEWAGEEETGEIMKLSNGMHSLMLSLNSLMLSLNSLMISL